MTKYTLLLLTLLLLSFAASTQTVEPAPSKAPDKGDIQVQEYPITNQVRSSALATFTNDFELTNVGFMHVYAMANTDPKGTYLMTGEEISSTTRALLPAKYQRMAKTMNAKLYGAAEIRGVGESLYIVRMDGDRSDRLEMFAMRDGKIKHLKTIAYRSCEEGACRQLDSFITDVDGDTDLDLIQIRRRVTKNGEKVYKPKAYILRDDGKKWVRTRKLELPTNSMQFYYPE
jgi:hypothetical protein